MLCKMNWLSLLTFLQVAQTRRCVMYLTGQHVVVPELSMVQDVTHVIMAFMQSSTFNVQNATEWPLFSSVEQARSRFPPETAVMIGIGGWGDTGGFVMGAATDSSRRLFAENVRKMVEETGADGVDIDWEYPGGNGDDYKRIPNSEKAWEIDAYPELVAEIRKAVGPRKLLSAAVPGLQRDMLAFTKQNIHQLSNSLDFFNIMTYDLMNRRDNTTQHHTGVKLSLDGLNAYLKNGVSPSKANLGFAFYAKWFKTSLEDRSECIARQGLGCKTALLEDPQTGDDLGQAGGFSWHDQIPSEVADSFSRAQQDGKYDPRDGGYFFWDEAENIFWTWDTPYAINQKFPLIVDELDLGGVFAWGLGEDAPGFKHLQALTTALRKSSDPLHSADIYDSNSEGRLLWKEEL